MSKELHYISMLEKLTGQKVEIRPLTPAEIFLNEAFFHRTKDPLENLIHSFKSLFLQLKFCVEEKHKLEFFKDNIRQELIAYKEFISENYSDENTKAFKEKFKTLIDEIDHDLVKALGLPKFLRHALDAFEKNDKSALDEAFAHYLKVLDYHIMQTFSLFAKIRKRNPDYEPLRQLKIVTSKITPEEFLKEKYFLQIELLKLQEWVKANNKRLLIIFEGRDAAGKGSSIDLITESLNPKDYRVESFNHPTEEEQNNWFERYKKVLPQDGEIVFFDRSWYNRAVIEPVMGYCTKEQYKDFIKNVNAFEEEITKSEVILLKIWLSISKDTQAFHFELRKTNPLRYWKYSDNDRDSLEKFDAFSKYIDIMFAITDIPENPWIIIDANDGRVSKLDVMRKILQRFPYPNKVQRVVEPPALETLDKVIFLDIDGVFIPFEDKKQPYHQYFNEDKHWSKEALTLLSKLISKTDAKIVLSSSYRKSRSKQEIEQRFESLGFDHPIYDVTPSIKASKRGAEVLSWIEKHKVNNYIIIDDNKFDFEKLFPGKLVRTNHQKGFTKEDYIRALTLLRK